MVRLTLLASACIVSPAAADSFRADASCMPTATALVFTCEFTLSEGDVPVEGAAFTIWPGMPSMPMAHKIPHLSAAPTDSPGVYAAEVEALMPGGWTLTLDLSAPRRDRIVLPQAFGVAPPDHHTTDHSGHAASD